MKRLEELALKEVDEGLTKAESIELDQLLRSDPAIETRYHQLRDVEVMLRNFDENLDVSDRVMEKVRPDPQPVMVENPADRWILRIAISTGAAAILVLAIYFIQSKPDVAMQGGLEIASRGSTHVKPNDRIIAKKEKGSIVYQDKSQVNLARGSELIFEPQTQFEEPASKRLELITGSLQAEVARQPADAPFVVKTPHAYAIVRGTRFDLSTDEKQTRLEVEHGQVDLRRLSGDAAVVVSAGMFAVTDDTGEFVARPLRVSEDLIAFYTFQKGDQNRVPDRSDFGEPLNLQVNGPNPNSIAWTETEGVSFTKRSHFESETPAKKIRVACQQSNALTVEAWIKPAETVQAGPARIVTISDESERMNFILGHDENNYILRLNTTANTSREVFVAGPVTTDLTHVVFTRESSGQWKFYLNGQTKTSGVSEGSFARWVEGLHLGIGDDPGRVDRFWQGSYHLVALYSRALTEIEVETNYSAGSRHH